MKHRRRHIDFLEVETRSVIREVRSVLGYLAVLLDQGSYGV